MPKPTIWLASTNPAKLTRLAWLVEGLPLEPRPLTDGPLLPAPDETGESYAENARLKAAYYSERLPGLVLVSDGGAEIPVLGDRWRGVHTGRAAGAVDDEGKLRYILDLLAPYRSDQRRAYWNEAVALAEGGNVRALWTVTSEPAILAESYDPARLMRGFWLANLWVYPDLGKTHAELYAENPAHVADHWAHLRDTIRADFQTFSQDELPRLDTL